MRYAITVPDQEYFNQNIPCRAACPIHTECGRYATERHNLGAGHDPARKKLPPAPKRGKSIAIVGAGVCGLTGAHDLALLGYTVEVFESAPVPGGMLYLGIPHFRLPREIIKMEVDNILSMDVMLHTRVA